jgi:hypothetical protein
LGIFGAAVLLAMWFAHFNLFRATGVVAWIGTIVVVENVIASLQVRTCSISSMVGSMSSVWGSWAA